MLEVIFALEKFHHYVYGYKTEVQTDHQPLVTIVKKPLYRESFTKASVDATSTYAL